MIYDYGYEDQLIKRAECALEDRAREDVSVLEMDWESLGLLVAQRLATPGDEARELIDAQIERSFNAALGEYIKQNVEDMIAEIREFDRSISEDENG
jgi:hypothetical protein